jgi:hypothetical protein
MEHGHIAHQESTRLVLVTIKGRWTNDIGEKKEKKKRIKETQTKKKKERKKTAKTRIKREE